MDMTSVRIFQFFQFYLNHKPTEPDYFFMFSVTCNFVIPRAISSVVKNSENNTQNAMYILCNTF